MTYPETFPSIAAEMEWRRQNPVTCERCGRQTADHDLWDPEAGTGRIFCDSCWPLRDDGKSPADRRHPRVNFA